MRRTLLFSLLIMLAGHTFAQTHLEEAAEALEEQMERLGEQLEAAFEARWEGWEERPWLGLRTESVTAEKASRKGWPHRYGAYVAQVLAGSPAEQAGIEPFDYIIAVDGEPLDRFHDLKDLMATKKAGQPVTLTLIRNGTTLEVRVRPGYRSDFFRKTSWRRPTILGLMASGAPDARGVPVKVVPGSLMDRLGVRDGDRIRAINGREITDWQDLRIAALNLAPGDEVVVTIARNDTTRTLHGTVGKKGGATRQWCEPQGQGQSGQRPWLGVEYTHPADWKLEYWHIDNPHGILVTRILPGSPAERAGLKTMDYLVGINGEEVSEETSFTRLLLRHQPGDRIELALMRKGARLTLPVALASANERTTPGPLDDCQRPFLGLQRSDDLEGRPGIRVDIVPGGTAERAEMQDGDILLAVDGYPILEWSDLTIVLRNFQPGQMVEVEYARNGQRQKRRVALTSRAEAKNCPDCNCDQATTAALSNEQLSFRLSDGTSEDAKRVKGLLGRLATADYAAALPEVEVIHQADGILVRLYSPSPTDAAIWLIAPDGRVRYEFEMASLEGVNEDLIKRELLPHGTSTLVVLLGDRFTLKRLKSD